MSPRIRVAGVAVSVSALAALILLLARPSLDPAQIKPIVLVGAAWIAFGCAAWLLRRVAVRVAVGLILIGGIAVQVVALAGPPQSSSDMYRYIWDGRVQAAGIDPYLYAPSAAGVAQLRNDFLWSQKGPNAYPDCVTKRVDHENPANSRVAGCTKLNRPKVPTVYPPVAEAYFFAVQLASPADNSSTPMQAAAAVFAVAVLVILLYGLRWLGKDLRLAALWAWCPTVALEAGQNGHVDVVAVALAAVALLLLARARTEGRVAIGGVLIGLAIATKVTPLLVLPAVLRRGWWLISTSAATAVALVYAPHVMAVGHRIIGFFPGYLKQEGYSTGTGFSVIGLFVQGKVATAVAVVLLGLVALAILRYGNPDEPWRGGVLMTSAALAVCTPHFQWYAILLVMLVALDGRPEWLAIAAGGYLAGSPHLHIDGITLHDPRLAGYGGGAVIAGALALTRYVLERRTREGYATPTPASTPVLAQALPAGAVRADVASADVVPGEATAFGAAVDAAAVDAAAVDAAAVDAAAFDETAPIPVVEPTAVYPPAVTVTIGTNGMPAFATDDNHWRP